MGAKQHSGSSVKYGTGQYDKSAHKGGGKNQKLMPPAVGTGYGKPTPNSPSAIARDGVEGHANPKRGYQTDAHSGSHHGKNGEAVGHKSDLHMNYDKELYSEGREAPPEGRNPGHISQTSQGKAAKAAHHPPVNNASHKFEKLPAKDAHGFGYGSSNKSGHLRMSGHSRAHQVGKR